MEIEYSNEIRGEAYAYRFQEWERWAIAVGLKYEVKKREIKIDKLRNHKDNEGQVSFQTAIEDLEREIEVLQEIIVDWGKKKKKKIKAETINIF